MENREELIAKFVDDIAGHDFKAVQTVADHKTVAITVKYKEVNQVLSILLVDYRGEFPNAYLQQDGTLKPYVNIDFVFRTAALQRKFKYAGITIPAWLHEQLNR